MRAGGASGNLASMSMPCDTLGIRKAAEPLRSNGANAEPGVARPARFVWQWISEF